MPTADLKSAVGIYPFYASDRNMDIKSDVILNISNSCVAGTGFPLVTNTPMKI